MTRSPNCLTWGLGFLATAVVAYSLAATGVNLWLSHLLRPLGEGVPALNLIWVLGGLPLTAAVVLVAGFGRREFQVGRLVIFFAVGIVVEVLAKHFIPTPSPRATFEPLFYQHLEQATNVTPTMALGLLSHWVPMTQGHGTSHLLKGTFPSGHVFRITYASGALLGPRRNWTVLVAAVATLAVVATGGHFVWDAVGGFVLARFMLSWAVGSHRG